MATNIKDYKKIGTNMYRHKKYNNKFFFIIKINKKRHHKSLTIKEELTTTEYKTKALQEYTKFYNSLNNIVDKHLHQDYKNINTLHDLFMFKYNSQSEKEKNKKWIKDHLSYYENHIKKYFIDLNISLKDLKANDIQYFLSNHMENKINPKTNTHYSNRTIKRGYEILKPMFKWAYTNSVIKDDIAAKIEYKRKIKTKIVINATQKYLQLYNAINKVFSGNLFWKVFFLFGLIAGRRSGEIKKLKISNIDLQNNLYIIEDTKNGETQQYTLPHEIKEDLAKLYEKNKDNISGLLFEKENTHNKQIINITKQVKLIKTAINDESFSFHKFRHILVSYLAEQGVDAIYLSGIIGHKHANSINSYLSLNYKKSSQKIDEINENTLILEVDSLTDFRFLIREHEKMEEGKEKEKIAKIIKHNFNKFF